MTGLGEEHHLHHWDPLPLVLALLWDLASTPNPASTIVLALYWRDKRGWQGGISHPANHSHPSFCPLRPGIKEFFLPSFTQGWRQTLQGPGQNENPGREVNLPLLQWPTVSIHSSQMTPRGSEPPWWTHLIPDGVGEGPCLCCPLSKPGVASLGQSWPSPAQPQDAMGHTPAGTRE